MKEFRIIAAMLVVLVLTASIALAQPKDAGKDTRATPQDRGSSWTERGTEHGSSKWQPGSLISADSLQNRNVYDQNNKEIAEVERLIINPQDGRVEFVVLGRGGFLEIGEDKIIVPWQAFAMTDKGLKLNIPADKLNNAPRYNKGEFANLNDPSSRQKVYSYYGMTPGHGPAMGGTQGQQKNQ